MDHQEHNLDWFPRMRAMSLVSSDAEGEQNEIRNLQEKLESTMRLVANLSGQLTELKEQVHHVTVNHACQHFVELFVFCLHFNGILRIADVIRNLHPHHYHLFMSNNTGRVLGALVAYKCTSPSPLWNS